MSAFPNSATAPAPAPARVAPPEPAPRRLGRKGWLLVVLIAAIAAGAWLLRPRKEQPAAQQTVVRLFKVAPATLERTIRVAGTTSARNFANIVAPMMRGGDSARSLTLIFLAKSGAIVKKGDLLAEIDAQAAKDHIDDIHALVVQADGDVRKRKADQAIQKENLQQSLRAAKADLDKAKLDYGAQEIRTVIDQELLKLTVDEAEARYQELVEEVKISEVSRVAEIRILELTRDRHQRHRDRHKGDVEKFKITAPMSGLVVMQSIWRGGDMGQVQLGDQVSPGQPFMKIVDTASMQLEATVNQADSEEIRIGQPAAVNFDAFPDLHVTGRVHSIAALAVGGRFSTYYVRAVGLNIAIQSADSRMIPDLSASGNIRVGEKENALPVPLEAVFREGRKAVVYVKQGDGFTPREVSLGLESNTQVAVLAGLRAGDEIALSRPAAAPKL